MINNLSAIGYGIIGLAILIGIGLVVLGQLGTTVSSCGTGFTYQTNGSVSYTTGLCCNSTSSDCGTGVTGVNWTNPSTATQNLNTIGGTYIATNLVSWIPVIIVLVIGMLFLGAFLARKGKTYS